MADQKKLMGYSKQRGRLTYSLYVYTDNHKAKPLPHETELEKMFTDIVNTHYAQMVEEESNAEALETARKQLEEEEKRKKKESEKPQPQT